MVCIIDDDRSVRNALKRLLLSAGFSARTYASAKEFLDDDSCSDLLCVISDVKMHGMSGLDLSRKLKAGGRCATFIFLTAHDTPEARLEAQESGGVAYFRKPVDDQALIDAIEWAASRQGGKSRSGEISNGNKTKVQ
ncbi:MAG TPA: response regulator [Kiritimatiellia bacterium]|nr:response regulator [Kiritimatiellia bacterium]